MRKGTSSHSAIHNDRFTNIENIAGSKFDDEIIGDDKNNKLFGEDGDDKIHGGDGNDIIEGGAGADQIDGGEGKDTIAFQKSEDGVSVDLENGIGKEGDAKGDTYENIENIIGSKFNDVLVGDKKDNVIDGSSGDDEIYGGEGNDILIGGDGADFLDGGIGIDTVAYLSSKEAVEVDLTKKEGKGGDAEGDKYESIERVIGSKFADKIIGGKYQDILEGNEGDDEIHGKGGDDIISGGEGNNKLYGEEGNDKFHLEYGNNEVEGGTGLDTISYEHYRKIEYDIIVKFYQLKAEGKLLAEKAGEKFEEVDFDKKGVEINLKEGVVKKGKELIDKVSSVEYVVGSMFSDDIIGDDGANYIQGLDGNDRIYGGKGNDIINAGTGWKNEVYGEEGDDLIIGSISTEYIDGGEGNDSVTYRNSESGVTVNLSTGICKGGYAENDRLKGIENIEGSEFNDIVHDGENSNVIDTGEGDDQIFLSSGDDIASGGEGNDKIHVSGPGTKYLFGGKGADQFSFTKNFTSEKSAGVIIFDFDVDSDDKIDLSDFEGINYENIKISSKTIAITSIQLPKVIEQYMAGDNKELDFTVIELSNMKEIYLFDVEDYSLKEEGFIFQEGAKENSNEMLQIGSAGGMYEEL